MWKLLKSLPKTWRHKVYSPLVSNPCTEESADTSKSDGRPDLLTCNTTFNEEASALSISDQERDNRVKPPNRCLYVWWFSKTLRPQADHHECPVRSFIEAFCVGVNSLLEKKRTLSASCGKLVDHHVKENHLRLSTSLAKIVFSKRSLGSSHSVLPKRRSEVSVSSTSSLSDTEQSLSTNASGESYSESSPSTSQQFENDDILNQLEELAREHASHILNSDAKRLVKQKQYGQALAMFNSAGKLGLAEAKYNLGVCYESGIGMAPDINKALRYFSEAAMQGHAGALYNLAVFHLEGKGVPVNKVRGVEYMEKASKGGIKEAHTFLGVHCGQHGEYKKAVQYFQKASDQKDPEGEYYLGVCYDNGVGVEENINIAIDFYKKSSEAGNAEACYILGTYYDEGLRGVPKDKSTALDMYQKAASKGHLLATERLKWSSHEDDEDDLIVFEDREMSGCSSIDSSEFGSQSSLFEDEEDSSSSSIETTESTLRTVKSSPELSQFYDVSSNHVTKLPSNVHNFDFSSVTKLIEYWNNGIGVPVKHSNDNKFHPFGQNNGLSQSLTKLSAVGTSPQFWDANTPKSSLVSLR